VSDHKEVLCDPITKADAGSAEETRDQGFRSTVLLDQDHAGSILGAEGTPSAVMINEHGIVASEVRVGAAQVFDLAQGKI
jgi:hypothetical protein